MNHTGNNYQGSKGYIVIFGAGRIGRSFIGQLFSRGGYEIVFIDSDPELVGRLNESGCYRVVIKGEADEEIVVSGVTALLADNKVKIAEVIAGASMLAVSVGKNALALTVPLIAEGIVQRSHRHPGLPLDIIIAENMRNAAGYMKSLLMEYLPGGFPVDTTVGLIETSIGKMVPIMTRADLERDPLAVYAESYNTLILDGKAFRGPVPDVPGLAPKENMKAWVDRKAFIHNLGHATAAYYGHFLFPDTIYIYEVLENNPVREFTRQVMMQSAEILREAYPDEFTVRDLTEHIDDLLYRFANRALRDTIFRVGHDLKRKLAADDRFMGAIMLGKRYCKPYDAILKAMSYGFRFRAAGENGIMYQGDADLIREISTGFSAALENSLGIRPGMLTADDYSVLSAFAGL